jgi:hypothetical protein
MKQHFLIAAIVMLAIMNGPCTNVAGSQAVEDPFSPEQYRWAIGWINGPL